MPHRLLKSSTSSRRRCVMHRVLRMRVVTAHVLVVTSNRRWIIRKDPAGAS